MEDSPTPDDLIWIEDAAVAFMRSRQWLQAHVTTYDIPGDRRVYVSEAEVAEAIRPRRREIEPAK